MKTCLPAGRSAFFFFRPKVSVSNESPTDGTCDRRPLIAMGPTTAVGMQFRTPTVSKSYTALAYRKLIS